MHLHLIQFITLLLLVLVTGVFWGPWLALHRSLHVFSKEEFLKITKTLGKNLGRPMQIMMPICITMMGLSLLLFPDKRSTDFFLLAVSFSCLLLTLTVTLITELPIVNKVRQWKVDCVPANWESIRDKWVKFHTLRVFPALLSLALYLAVVLDII